MAKLPPPQKEIGWYDDDDEWEDHSIFTTQLPGPVYAIEQQEKNVEDNMNAVVAAGSTEASSFISGTSDNAEQDVASSALVNTHGKADNVMEVSVALTSKSLSTETSPPGAVAVGKDVTRTPTKNADVSETGEKQSVEGVLCAPRPDKESIVDLVAMRRTLEDAGVSPHAVEAAIIAVIASTATPSASSSKDSHRDEGMAKSAESRFELVGEAVTTELFIHPLRKAQEIKPAPLKASQPQQAPQLAICDIPSRQPNDGLPKCMNSFKLGYETGLMFAKGLIEQALSVDQSIFANVIQTPAPQPSRNSTPRRKIGMKAKQREESREPGESGEEAPEPLRKKAKVGRNRYTEEEDETLKEVASRILIESPGISDNKLYKRIHEECGLDRSFCSIESRMKRFIKADIVVNE